MYAIPKEITSAAVSMLSPYNPSLTPEKLEAAILTPKEQVEDRLRTRQEAKEILHVSMPTIDRMIKDGSLPKRKVRGRVLIPQSALEEIIRGQVAA